MEFQIANFIETVRKHPVLYDKKLLKYRDINHKAAVWRRIAEEYGFLGLNYELCIRNKK